MRDMLNRLLGVLGHRRRGSSFNEQNYWLRRHQKYRGDARSVGNTKLSREQNERAQDVLCERFRAILGILYPNGAAGKSVLDLGCGIARAAPAFGDLGFEYTGIELSPVALEEAKVRYPAGRFVCGDIVTFRPERQYDIVLVSHVLVHLVHDPDWQAGLQVIADSLHHDGVCILSEKIPTDEVKEQAAHVRTRSEEAYLKSLRTHDLRFDAEFRERAIRELPDANLSSTFFIKRAAAES